MYSQSPLLWEPVLRAQQYAAAVPGWFWAALYFGWLTMAVIFILLQRRPPSATLAWMIGFVSLPVVSAIVYFFFGPRKLRRRRMRRALARRLAEQSAPACGTDDNQQAFDQQTWFAPIARVAMSDGDPGPVRASQIQMLVNGDPTFAAIEQALSQAHTQIHLEYYIFEPDEIGARWRDLLASRAAAGVKVRVLLDAIGSGRCDHEFWEPVTRHGGQIRYFNPVRVLRLKAGRLNFRTHRKIVVIDGAIGFTGGINVMAENSAALFGADAWRDTHLKIEGPPVHDLQVIFLEDWLYANDLDSPWLRPDKAEISTPDDLQRWFPSYPLSTGPWVQIIDSGPDESVPDIHRFIFTAIAQATERVWITTPYFVPDEAMITAIATASARGIDVRIMIPYKSDSRLVNAAAWTFADEVADCGAHVMCYGPAMNHAKTMVVDQDLAMIGTANMDNRSFRLNFEVVAAIYDRQLTSELAELFLRDCDHCQTYEPHRHDRSFFERLIGSIARLFAPLL